MAQPDITCPCTRPDGSWQCCTCKKHIESHDDKNKAWTRNGHHYCAKECLDEDSHRFGQRQGA